jgi:hypothetical protein
MARVKAAITGPVTTAGSETGAGLKVSAADYGMACAEVRGPATETGAPTEMASPAETASPTEMCAATTEMCAAATTTEVTAATTREMATATAAAPEMATATSAAVSSSGAGRHGGTRSERGHGEDLEGPAEKSCLSHLGRHVTSPRRCTPVRHTRGTNALPD